MFNPFVNSTGVGNGNETLIIKGTLNSKDELPQYQEDAEDNPIVGWVYLVKTKDGDELEEYLFTEEHKWEKFGYVPVATINDVKIEGELSSTDDLKIAGRIVTGQIIEIDGNNVTAGTGVEIFNDYENNKASGNYSHAEGSFTTASGNYCHAEGSGTASGDYSHAEGGGTTASGMNSHSEGGGTTASGMNSHSEGGGTTASGMNSHSEGGGTIASGDYQHVMGKYNIEDAESYYAFIIGNGDNNNHSNAFAITWDGKIYANNSETGVNVNELEQRVASIESTPSMGATINYVAVNGILDSVDNLRIPGKVIAGQSFTIHGTNVTAKNNTEIFNNYIDNKAVGQYSHAEGYRTIAGGNQSHAECMGTTASGNNSHAEGGETTASGAYSHAEGGETTASGEYSHAEGEGTTASGLSSHAEGHRTTASGDYSHAEGNNTKASGRNQHVIGTYNTEDKESKYAFIIGNGKQTGMSTFTRSNAFAIDWNGNIYTNNSETGININNLNTEINTKIAELSTEKADKTDLDGLKFKYISEAEYNSLEVKDDNIIYFVS